MPFTLVRAGKYRTKDKSQTMQKLNTTTQNTAKQNYPGLVAFYDTQPGNDVDLLYNAPELTRGHYLIQYVTRHDYTRLS